MEAIAIALEAEAIATKVKLADEQTVGARGRRTLLRLGNKAKYPDHIKSKWERCLSFYLHNEKRR